LPSEALKWGVLAEQTVLRLGTCLSPHSSVLSWISRDV